MEVHGKTRTWVQVVRWSWVPILGLLTLIGLALAPASGLGTLPFALTTGGLALWFARGGPQQRPGETVQWLVAVGMAGMALLLIVLLVD